jgi:hypothetical protein
MKRSIFSSSRMIQRGTGWDETRPGPIADNRWKMYQEQDGTTYVVLDSFELYKKGNTAAGIAWGPWTVLEPET